MLLDKFKIEMGLQHFLISIKRVDPGKWIHSRALVQTFINPSIVPAECLAGTRFDFYFEFIVTLSMPLVLVGIIALALLLVRTVGIKLRWPRAGPEKTEERREATEVTITAPKSTATLSSMTGSLDSLL